MKQRSASIQLGVEVLAFAAMAAIISQYFLPADTAKMMAGVIVAYAIPRFLYSRLNCHNRTGSIVLMVAGLGLAALAILHFYSYTVAHGATFDHPHLTSDDSGYFNWALYHYNGTGEEPDTKFLGFPFMMLCTWKLFGVNIVWPTAVNMMCTLFSLILSGQVAARMLEGRVKTDSKHIAATAMVATVILIYFMSEGLRLQKEAMTYLGVMLAAYGIARLKCLDNSRWSRTWADLTLFALGTFILAVTRTGVTYFVLAGIVLATLDNRKQWRYGLLLIGIVLIMAGLGIHFANRFTIGRQMRIIGGAYNGGDIMSVAYTASDAQQAYAQMLGDYHHFPMWQKLLLLPFTSIVQFVIPFPWVTIGETTFLSYIPRLQWGWYLVGGIALFYYLFLSWRRKGRSLGFWALWPLVCFLGAAFVTGGSVSRYALPYQPLFATLAVFVYYRLREGQHRRSFTIWSALYILTLATALITCYTL